MASASPLPALFYPCGMQPARGLSRAEIKHGFRLFFLNQPEKSRRFFSQYEGERDDRGVD